MLVPETVYYHILIRWTSSWTDGEKLVKVYLSGVSLWLI
jgi:hypothetical protein